MLVILWWLQELGKVCLWDKKQHIDLLFRGLISKILSKMEVRKQYKIEIWNGFAALQK
jgi:hypothetical protein